MNKRLVLALLIGSFFVYSFALEVMLLHTNDHHGSLYRYWYELQEVAGLAERAHIIRQITEGEENYLLLDAGDMNTGVYESLIFEAEPDILAYNLIEYNAMTLGNHEFYGDLERIQRQIEWAEFHMLSANVFTLEGELVGEPYIMFTMPNGLIVAVLGLTTTHKELSSDFVVKCDVEIAKEIVPQLREKADIVIALTHLGIYDFGVEELYGSIRLASNVPGIDLIIDGDSHTLLEEPAFVNGIPIVQVGERGRHLGKAVLNFDPETKAVSLKSWEAIPLMRSWDHPAFEISYDVLDVVDFFRLKAIETGNELIGYSDRDFRQIQIRSRITALGRIIGEAMLHAAKEYDAVVGIFNSGGIRADLLRGEIRLSDIHNILPFEDEVVVLELPGTVLLEIIRTAFLEKIETGAFLQYSNNVGIIQRPVNQVIPNLNGVELQADMTYRIATNTFLAEGGDGYDLFEMASNKINAGISTRDALIEYIKNSPFFRLEE